MAEPKTCPVCGRKTYKEFEGKYDTDGLKKISPDFGRCDYCGFRYQKGISKPLEEQAREYINFFIEEYKEKREQDLSSTSTEPVVAIDGLGNQQIKVNKTTLECPKCGNTFEIIPLIVRDSE